MIQLNIMGRMGNQMFQYAYARAVQIKTGQELTINWGNVINYNSNDKGYEDSLKNFNVHDYKSETELEMTWIQKVVDKLFERGILRNRWDPYNRYVLEKKYAKLLNLFGLYYIRSGYYCFKKFYGKNIILSGNFESPKFIEEIDDVLRREFVPKYPPLESNKKMYEEMKLTQSVCVSIRRGDYYASDMNKRFRVITADYYKKGIDYILEKHPDAHLFVFSDDINWVKENIKFDCPVTYESGTDPNWETLRLMSSCKHFVISNSTFQWWAQHLGNYENKIVVAPNIWIRDEETNEELDKMRKDIYEDSWIQIEV